MRSKSDFLTIAKFFIFPIFIYLFNYVLLFLGGYDNWPKIGMLMHFIGGISVGSAFFLTLKYLQDKDYLRMNKFFLIFFVVSLVSLTAISWEFYQFTFDYLFGTYLLGTLEDTLLDLFLGIFGGLSISIFLGLKYRT